MTKYTYRVESEADTFRHRMHDHPDMPEHCNHRIVLFFIKRNPELDDWPDDPEIPATLEQPIPFTYYGPKFPSVDEAVWQLKTTVRALIDIWRPLHPTTDLFRIGMDADLARIDFEDVLPYIKWRTPHLESITLTIEGLRILNDYKYQMYSAWKLINRMTGADGAWDGFVVFETEEELDNWLG